MQKPQINVNNQTSELNIEFRFGREITHRLFDYNHCNQTSKVESNDALEV